MQLLTEGTKWRATRKLLHVSIMNMSSTSDSTKCSLERSAHVHDRFVWITVSMVLLVVTITPHKRMSCIHYILTYETRRRLNVASNVCTCSMAHVVFEYVCAWLTKHYKHTRGTHGLCTCVLDLVECCQSLSASSKTTYTIYEYLTK